MKIKAEISLWTAVCHNVLLLVISDCVWRPLTVILTLRCLVRICLIWVLRFFCYWAKSIVVIGIQVTLSHNKIQIGCLLLSIETRARRLGFFVVVTKVLKITWRNNFLLLRRIQPLTLLLWKEILILLIDIKEIGQKELLILVLFITGWALLGSKVTRLEW